jgi:hypothetical protein
MVEQKGALKAKWATLGPKAAAKEHRPSWRMKEKWTPWTLAGRPAVEYRH